MQSAFVSLFHGGEARIDFFGLLQTSIGLLPSSAFFLGSRVARFGSGLSLMQIHYWLSSAFV
jgi:hypothetical protein